MTATIAVSGRFLNGSGSAKCEICELADERRRMSDEQVEEPSPVGGGESTSNNGSGGACESPDGTESSLIQSSFSERYDIGENLSKSWRQ